MAEPDPNQLKLKGPMGLDLAASGPTLIAIIALAAFIAVGVLLRDTVRKENDAVRETVRNENALVRGVVEYLDCRVQLNMYLGLRPRGDPVDWNAMPEGLYKCLPDFLTKKR